MIDIGTTRFLVNVPVLPRHEFESYSTRLFDEWGKQVDGTLTLPDYFLALDIEEGSLKGRGKIALTLGALYIGIGNYGGFISGLETIRNQVSAASDYLAERAVHPFQSTVPKVSIRKDGDSLSSLHRLFAKVRRQEMTVEEAMRQAEALLGEEAGTVPEFMQQLHASLRQVPLLPQQLALFLDAPDDNSSEPPSDAEKRARSRESKPNIPPPERMRVEIWRESKNGKRNVRVMEL